MTTVLLRPVYPIPLMKRNAVDKTLSMANAHVNGPEAAVTPNNTQCVGDEG